MGEKVRSRSHIYIIIFIITILLLQNINAKTVIANESNNTLNDRLFAKLLIELGKIFAFAFPIIQLSILSVKADPPIINISYNKPKVIQIGIIDTTSGDFELYNKSINERIFKYRFLKFQTIKAPSDQKESWFISFDPNSVIAEKGSILKTNVSIKLTSPPIASNAIQNGILRIRISDIWALGSLWFPPKESERAKHFDTKWGWFFAALFSFGWESGTISTTKEDVNVLIKVQPYHSIQFDTERLKSYGPNQLATISLNVTNLGNYVDTFIFKIIGKDHKNLVCNPVSITLDPGETFIISPQNI